MSYQVLVSSSIRVVRIVSICVLLAAMLLATLLAWGLASAAIALMRKHSEAVAVPAVQLALPAAHTQLALPGSSTQLALPAWSWSRPLPKHQFKASLEQSRLEWMALGFGLPATNRVLVAPVRLCLPAVSSFADYAGYDEWLDEREAVEERSELESLTVQQLRQLARTRGIARISKLKRKELIQALS